jgi:hypothetical protein
MSCRRLSRAGLEFLDERTDSTTHWTSGGDGSLDERGHMDAQSLRSRRPARRLWSSAQRKPIFSFLTWDVRQLKSSATTWRSNDEAV